MWPWRAGCTFLRAPAAWSPTSGSPPTCTSTAVGARPRVTIRFRYTPEAGGGSGYLLSIDPFAGQVRLVRFEEGRQYALVPWTGHPAAVTAAAPLHVDLTACGSEVAVALNGDEVLRTTDGWFDRGTIALGAVTWSEPVSVTFENVSLTLAPE